MELVKNYLKVNGYEETLKCLTSTNLTNSQSLSKTE